jgi:CHAD domain-containing protein
MTGGLDAPHFAKPPKLSDKLPVQRVAQGVLREMFVQFTNDLDSLRRSDDPELVHQARIGWRRLKSGLRLFKKLIPSPPSLAGLRPLVADLGELRNLEVALTETLPPLAKAYVMDDSQRARLWQRLLEVLKQKIDLQRNAVRHSLELPKVGAALLAMAQWLEDLPDAEPIQQAKSGALRHWAEHQILRLDKQMMRARTAANSADQWHRTRILAKRLRYSAQALQDLLPHPLAKNCVSAAAAIQGSIGAKRDVAQACALVMKLNLDRGIAEFLRGVVVGAEPR